MSSSRNRTSIKSTTNVAWKDKLREECLTRLDAARSRLLDAARQSRTAGQAGVTQAALRTIIGDSSAHLQHKPDNSLDATDPQVLTPESTGATPSAAAAVFPAPSPCITTQPTSGEDPFPDNPFTIHSAVYSRYSRENRATAGWEEMKEPGPPEFSGLSRDEYEDLMRMLEASLYEDVLREEADYLESLEQQDVDNMVEAHFGRMALGSSSQDDEDMVLCPMCSDAWLIQRNGVILCPKRHLRLDAAMEGLHLRDLKARLASVLESHAAQRCRDQVVFEQTGVAGMNSLLMKCDTCGALEIVL